ncbi:MAG: hypothetical protein LBR83_06630, partial [Clostridiales bacterium]|nr:hypothetical protein [Clostridiales bacterium]
MAKKTDELDFELQNTNSLDAFIQNNEAEFDDSRFYKLLNRLITENGGSKSGIAAESGVSEPYLYNIINAQKRPARDTVVKL